VALQEFNESKRAHGLARTLRTSTGIAGAIRFLISSVSATIYTVILTHELAVKIPPRVTSAVEAAGLPASSVAQFIQAFSVGTTAFEQIPGINADILSAGTKAYKDANASACT